MRSLFKWFFIACGVAFLGWASFGVYYYLAYKDVLIVSSGSMAPALEVGDRVRLDRDAYRTRKPEVGEIVIIKTEVDRQDNLFVYRLMAGPGDTVQFIKGKLYVNEKPISAQLVGKTGEYEEYTETVGKRSFSVRYDLNRSDLGDISMLMRDGDYFVVGDNRDKSRDSRFIGPVPLSAIVGRVTKVVESSDKAKIGREL